MNMTRRISFTVHGRVQGVSFRYFTRKRAISCGLTGWVRNTVDSKVQGEAQGPDTIIEEFIKALNQGPTHAKVSKLETTTIDIVEGENAFEVRH